MSFCLIKKLKKKYKTNKENTFLLINYWIFLLIIFYYILNVNIINSFIITLVLWISVIIFARKDLIKVWFFSVLASFIYILPFYFIFNNWINKWYFKKYLISNKYDNNTNNNTCKKNICNNE